MRYKRLTLGDLIDGLTRLGKSTVEGLNGEVYSYRGYYERNATYPFGGHVRMGANELAESYRSYIGQPMMGWKGGDYIISEDELIYYADRGETGPSIIGFHCDHRGIWKPVLLEEDYHY